MAQLLNGTSIAQHLRLKLKNLISTCSPSLAVILVGNHGPSLKYIERKTKCAQDLGIKTHLYHLPETISESDLLDLIYQLNMDQSINGILIQLPLPDHLDRFTLLSAMDPLKDVDGLHPTNMGHLMAGRPQFIPCTPLGCLYLIHQWKKDLSGLKALVIGRSLLVGNPVSTLLLNENTTVTKAHRHTLHLEDLCRGADIIVAAAGSPHLVKGSWIKPGACVIDVGINIHGGHITGDVEFEKAQLVAGAITPVPGGVGPMTITFLMYNTLKAFYLQQGQDIPTHILD